MIYKDNSDKYVPEYLKEVCPHNNKLEPKGYLKFELGYGICIIPSMVCLDCDKTISEGNKIKVPEDLDFKNSDGIKAFFASKGFKEQYDTEVKLLEGKGERN